MSNSQKRGGRFSDSRQLTFLHFAYMIKLASTLAFVRRVYGRSCVFRQFVYNLNTEFYQGEERRKERIPKEALLCRVSVWNQLHRESLFFYAQIVYN